MLVFEFAGEGHHCDNASTILRIELLYVEMMNEICQSFLLLVEQETRLLFFDSIILFKGLDLKLGHESIHVIGQWEINI